MAVPALPSSSYYHCYPYQNMRVATSNILERSDLIWLVFHTHGFNLRHTLHYNFGCTLSLSPSNHVNHRSLFILIWISVEDKCCFVCWISYSHILTNSIPVLYSMNSVFYRAFDSTLPSGNLKRLISYSNYPLFLLYNLSLRQRDHQISLVVSL